MALYQNQLPGAGAALPEAGICYDLAYVRGSSGVNTPEYWPEVRYSHEDLMLAVRRHAEVAGPDRHGTHLKQTHVKGDYTIACPDIQSPGRAGFGADTMTRSTSACSEQGSSTSDTQSAKKKPIRRSHNWHGKAAVETVSYDVEVSQQPTKPDYMRMPGNLKLAFNKQVGLKLLCDGEKEPRSMMSQQQQQQQQQQQSQHQSQPATAVLPKAVRVDLSRLRLKM